MFKMSQLGFLVLLSFGLGMQTIWAGLVGLGIGLTINALFDKLDQITYLLRRQVPREIGPAEAAYMAYVPKVKTDRKGGNMQNKASQPRTTP